VSLGSVCAHMRMLDVGQHRRGASVSIHRVCVTLHISSATDQGCKLATCCIRLWIYREK
jgi:hypothetical protein